MIDLLFLLLLTFMHRSEAQPEASPGLARLLEHLGRLLLNTTPEHLNAELARVKPRLLRLMAHLPAWVPAPLGKVDPAGVVDRESVAARLYEQLRSAERVRQLVAAGDVGGALEAFDAHAAATDDGITIRLSCDDAVEAWPLILERIREVAGECGIDTADELVDALEQLESPL